MYVRAFVDFLQKQQKDQTKTPEAYALIAFMRPKL
jgi:hypothetical protein